MKLVTFSFDDGVVQDRQLVQALNRYGMKGTFHLNSSQWGAVQTLEHLGTVINYSILSFEEAADVYRGHEIAAHTWHHPSNLPLLSAEQMHREISENIRALEALSHRPISGLAYPCGMTDDNVIAYLRGSTSIRYARLAEPSGSFLPPKDWYRWQPTFRVTDPDLSVRVRSFLDAPDDGIRLLMIMGHAFELDKTPLGWFNFEQILRQISAQNGLIYCTNEEAQRIITDSAH